MNIGFIAEKSTRPGHGICTVISGQPHSCRERVVLCVLWWSKQLCMHKIKLFNIFVCHQPFLEHMMMINVVRQTTTYCTQKYLCRLPYNRLRNCLKINNYGTCTQLCFQTSTSAHRDPSAIVYVHIHLDSVFSLMSRTQISVTHKQR